MSTVDDVLALPIPERRHWIATLGRDSPRDLGLLFADARRERGTRWCFWRDDPVGFVQDCLGGWMSRRQQQALTSIRDEPRTAVPSGHGLGKAIRPLRPSPGGSRPAPPASRARFPLRRQRGKSSSPSGRISTVTTRTLASQDG